MFGFQIDAAAVVTGRRNVDRRFISNGGCKRPTCQNAPK